MKPTGEHDHRDITAIEAEAVAWLSERDEGFAPGRASAFEAWCRRDVRHAAVVAELEQVLQQLEGLAEHREEANRRFNRTSPASPVTEKVSEPAAVISWWRPVVWCGAAAAIAVGLFFGIRSLSPTIESEMRYTTTPAGYERARLDDGSTLELNMASAARVRFTAGERRIDLESGEAHFEVAHDTARPFVVNAGGVVVRAVGTAFNVRFSDETVEVTVTEGKVRVGPALSSTFQKQSPPPASQTGKESSAGSTGASGLAPLLLSANERLALPIASTERAAGSFVPTIERLAPAEVRAALAWQRRVTDFSDTTLAEVAARFNRHNTLQLIVNDPALGARRIGGMFALDDVEAFVRLMERDGVVRVEREGNIVSLQAP